MKDLTVVIPSYNNIEYLKLCYESIRKASKDVILHIMDDGSTDGTSEWMYRLKDANLKLSSSKTRSGHTRLYDIGFATATTEYIGILHSDMVVPENFFAVLNERLSHVDVVSARCVEPPLNGEGAEKIVMDFGMYPDSFDYDAFNQFALSASDWGALPSLFAPWFISRKKYFELIGGHDKQFAPYGHEDADLFVRMVKAGIFPMQYKNLMVYHFTQRGHRWNNGQVGNANEDYQLQMHITRNRFMTKWGTMMWKNDQHTPLLIPLYYKQLNIKNYNLEARNKYEFMNVFFNRVVADGQVILDDGSDNEPNYIVTFDYNVNYDLQSLYNYMMYIPFMIEQADDVGTFEHNGLVFEIKNLQQLPVRIHD